MRWHPIAYSTDGDRYVIVASKGGAPTSPDWYHNLVANALSRHRSRQRRHPRRGDASPTGAERERALRQHAARMPAASSTYCEEHDDHWDLRVLALPATQRWVMVDAISSTNCRRAATKPDFDPLDVPRDRFIIAGQAWQAVRSGAADGATFGIADIVGRHRFIGERPADSISRSLNKIELLAMRSRGSARTRRKRRTLRSTPLCDELAGLSGDPTASMAPLRRALRDATYVSTPPACR